MKIVSVFGTRPGAIKMAPVIREIGRRSGLEHIVCVTGQHREMLDQALNSFGITPDYDLGLMTLSNGLGDLAGNALKGLSEVLARESPDLVLVQGDTATALTGAIAAYYLGIPVGHVEAGLRSGDLTQPWPEEGNRKLIDAIATLHFAPTEGNRANLLAEGVAENRIWVTGNTVIDALYSTRQRIASIPPWRKNTAISEGVGRKRLLVTTHRRENLGARLKNIWAALIALADRGDCDLIYPLHLNPALAPAARHLRDEPAIKLVRPLDYGTLIRLLDRTDLILSDSGGLQEEATALGKPLLLMRDMTERPEAVEAGTVGLVGTDTSQIVQSANDLLDHPDALAAMARSSGVFGDGWAAERILDAIGKWRSGTVSPQDRAVASR